MPDFRLCQSLRIAALAAIAAIAGTAVPHNAVAGVYKCIDGNGGITYSQTPCPNQVTTQVATSSNDRSSDAMECAHAGAFALSVAQSMKRGKESAQAFGEYGGFETLSKSAVNIINYVYVFRHSADVPAERIAALTKNKCEARAFGDVRCEDMPPAHVQGIGGCEENQVAAGEPGPQPISAAARTSTTVERPTEPSVANARSMRIQARQTKAREAELRDTCRERSQAEIDRINAKMRNGYSSAQGERHRERLRELREDSRRC